MKLIEKLARVGRMPDDDEDVQLKKTLLVLCAVPFLLAGAAWGLLYIYVGESTAGLIPLSYSLVSLLSVIVFSITKRYQFFRLSQLTLILLLPFFLMISLGGYIKGSAVILWALLCPLGAMLFDETNTSPRWMFAFIGLLIVAGIMQPLLPEHNNLTPEIITVFFVMNIGGVGALVFFMVFYFVRQKNRYQEQSESLLLSILPKEIASILKKETRTIAQHYVSASVMFADMVGFTPLTSSMSPTAVVELLNAIFSHFDVLVEKHGLEKIKTIGDSYMVASGIPVVRADHATAIASLALDMRSYIERAVFLNDVRVRFRFGINSGPVTAGVIGKRKFVYDIWGDTVNTASRMESHGEGGLIQITRSTYELIADKFACEPRGVISVKGKGDIETWAVVMENG